MTRDYPTRNKPFSNGAKQEPRMQESSGDGYLKLFQWYGTQIEPFQRQLIGTCPFLDCMKERHFFASPGTGQWDCKRCLRTGNIYTFIHLLHQQFLEMMNEELYETLAGARPGIEWWAFQDWQVVYNVLTNEWMLPMFSAEGKLTNLHVWREFHDHNTGKTTHPVVSGPIFKQAPYGLHQLSTEKHRPLWLCEGHWDTLAWYTLLCRVTDRTGQPLIYSHDVIGAPGAGTFPKEYLHLLDGRDVRILFDNDKAGRAGIERLLKSISQNGCIPAKLGALVWPADMAQNDTRDLIKDTLAGSLAI